MNSVLALGLYMQRGGDAHVDISTTNADLLPSAADERAQLNAAFEAAVNVSVEFAKLTQPDTPPDIQITGTSTRTIAGEEYFAGSWYDANKGQYTDNYLRLHKGYMVWFTVAYTDDASKDSADAVLDAFTKSVEDFPTPAPSGEPTRPVSPSGEDMSGAWDGDVFTNAWADVTFELDAQTWMRSVAQSEYAVGFAVGYTGNTAASPITKVSLGYVSPEMYGDMGIIAPDGATPDTPQEIFDVSAGDMERVAADYGEQYAVENLGTSTRTIAGAEYFAGTLHYTTQGYYATSFMRDIDGYIVEIATQYTDETRAIVDAFLDALRANA
jgi:hypothetical protein